MSSLLSTLQYLHHGELSFEEIMLYFFFLSSLQNNSVWTNFSETACLETLGRNKTPKLQVSSSRYWFNCRECDCCWTVSQGRNWASFSAGHQQVLCSLRMRFTSLTFKWNFLGKHMSLYLSKTRERVMCLVFLVRLSLSSSDILRTRWVSGKSYSEYGMTRIHFNPGNEDSITTHTPALWSWVLKNSKFRSSTRQSQLRCLENVYSLILLFLFILILFVPTCYYENFQICRKID